MQQYIGPILYTILILLLTFDKLWTHFNDKFANETGEILYLYFMNYTFLYLKIKFLFFKFLSISNSYKTFLSVFNKISNKIKIKP